MRIQVDLNELAQFPMDELKVLKALVKLHLGQPMPQVIADLDLDTAVAQGIARFLVNEGGRQRLPFLFCDDMKGDFDQLAIEVTRVLNHELGTQYKQEDVRHKVRHWYERGYTEMMPYQSVIKDRADAWRSDPKLKTHLRPNTLFGERFEQYLNLSRISGTPSGQVSLDEEFTGV